MIPMRQIAEELVLKEVACSADLFPLVNRTLNDHHLQARISFKDQEIVEFKVVRMGDA